MLSRHWFHEHVGVARWLSWKDNVSHNYKKTALQEWEWAQHYPQFRELPVYRSMQENLQLWKINLWGVTSKCELAWSSDNLLMGRSTPNTSHVNCVAASMMHGNLALEYIRCGVRNDSVWS